MTSFNWKRFLLGSTAAAALTVPGIALADPTCAYVLGQVGENTVATPAVIIYVPDSSADVQPVRVHVDETLQSIIGYSLPLPGVEESIDPQAVFVPGVEYTLAPIYATTPELPIAAHRCVDQTVSTPAIPVYVPESVLTTPGAVVDVPVVELNIVGNPVTTAGKVIELPSKTIVIPAFETAVPGVSVTTPDKTIGVTFNTGATIAPVSYLAPNGTP